MWIANAARSREIDQQTIENHNIPASRLMERAGEAVVEVLVKTWPDATRIAILCGQGNNGGDGFAAAQLLLRAGKVVTCLVACEENQLSEDAAAQLAIANRSRLKAIFLDNPAWAESLNELDESDVIVDALLGTGTRLPLRTPYVEVVAAINASDSPVLSVDIPTGVDCDSGSVPGEAVWAHTTVTLGLPKPFLFLGEGPDRAGAWSAVDLGFPEEVLGQPTDATLLAPAWVSDRLPVRWHTSHKGTSGHVLVVAGSARYRGAAVLTCLGALRAGAGLVTLAAPEEVRAAVAAQLPEVVFMDRGEIGGAEYDAAIFGPGLTQELEISQFLASLWPTIQKPCVLDADALNLVATGLELPPGPCVLTPHPGEMGRLLQTDAAAVQADRFRSVRAFGRGTVLLKGANSLAWTQGQPIAVCPTGNSGMATAGMGDVLSGVVGALLAQGLSPYDAAACGMTLHGAAGDVCAEEIGPIGYSAQDLALALPKARAKISSS